MGHELTEPDGMFVGGALCVRRRAPLTAHRLAVEHRENGVGIAHIDGQKHGLVTPLESYLAGDK